MLVISPVEIKEFAAGWTADVPAGALSAVKNIWSRCGDVTSGAFSGECSKFKNWADRWTMGGRFWTFAWLGSASTPAPSIVTGSV